MADNQNISVLESENVEEMSGATLNSDGTYQASKVEDTRSMLEKFDSWCKATDTLQRCQDNDDGVSTEAVDGGLDTVIEVKSAFDNLGRAIKQGFKCPVCGKHIDYMLPSGYCSVACFTKDLTQRLLTHVKTDNDNPIQKIIDQIQGVLDKINLALNLLVELPDLMQSLVKIPEKYKDYIILNVNIAFLRLRKIINKLMIKKNEKIIELLKKVKNGVIPDALKSVFESVNTVIKTITSLQKSFNSAYDVALNALKTYGFQINAESMGWMFTPRSKMNSDAPYTYIELPTHTMEGISTNIMGEGIDNINYELIDTTIKGIFPPIKPAEYFLDPDLFDVRLLFSDQSDIVKQVREKLETLMVLGVEYMPRYKRMNPLNIWFLLGLMDGWCQHSKLDFGSLINPTA